MRVRARRLFPSLALSMTLAGCGAGSPVLVPVSGTVKFPDGKPVTSGIVEFAPESGGPGARGKIGADGTFSLKTGDLTGAVVGQHKIIVVQVFLADGAAAHLNASHKAAVVHPKYAKYESSGLRRDVRGQTENDISLVVDSATPPKKGW